MNLAAEFSAWVKDPRRTNDELFFAELLIEAGHQVWRTATKLPWSHAYYDQLNARRERRALDPAYRAKLSAKKLAHTVEVGAQMARVATEWREEYPVRDLAALRFFPHLIEVKIRSELRELSGLAILTGLRNLELDDGTLKDLSPLAKHAELEELTLAGFAATRSASNPRTVPPASGSPPADIAPVRAEAFLFAALSTLVLGIVVDTLNAQGVRIVIFAHGLGFGGAVMAVFVFWLVGGAIAQRQYK